MLCERPPNAQKDNGIHSAAFVPGCATQKLERLGLNPVKKVNTMMHLLSDWSYQNADGRYMCVGSKTRYAPCMQVHAAKPESKEPGINSTHREWIKDFDASQTKRKDEAEKAQIEAQSKVESISAFSEKLRRAVLNGDNVSEFWKAAKKRPQRTRPSIADDASPSCGPSADDASKLESEMIDFVNAIYSEAAESLKAKAPAVHGGGIMSSEPLKESSSKPPADSSVWPGTSDNPSSSDLISGAEADNIKSGKQRGVGSRKKAKAVWALSEGEAAAAQEEEERELLDFADNLDFGSFVDKLDDVELHDTFKVIRLK